MWAGTGLVHAQRLLGHADPKLTAKVYVHADREELRKAVECIPVTRSASRRDAS